MLPLGLQLHQVNNVDDANLQFRQLLAQDRYSSQRLQCRSLAAASHNNVRLLTGIVGSPLPNADTLCAVLDSLLHGQPLRTRMLRCNNNIDIVAAADAMIKAGQQAVCIRRQIQANHVCLLVCNVVKEARILMGKAVVILLPYVGSQNQVQGCNLLTPRQLVANLQPLCVLCCHRVDDADECFIACEEAMTTGQQVAFQPALAHMLGQHGIHDAAVLCEEFIGRQSLCIPIAVGCFKRSIQTVGSGLIRTKYAEVAAVLVELQDITDKLAHLDHVLTLGSARLTNWECIVAEVRQTQVTQQQTAVCVRVCTDSVVALRRQLTQFRNQTAVLIEQLLCMIALQPILQNFQMLRLVHHDRNLMCTEAVFDHVAVYFLRTGPALRGAQNDHRPYRTRCIAGFACVLLNCLDFLNDDVHGLSHLAMHGHRIITLYEVRLPAAALEVLLQLLMRDS